MATINTNLGAVRAANALATNERDMNGAMERLSTGKRINTAQDDAAGLAIASKMTSQINSLDQAVRNAGDAISLVQSADGAMIEVTNMVQRMRELAIQAISDTNTSSDRAALNLEFQALSAEISRIGGNTQWNGGTLLDGLNGTAGMSTFHIGANANQTITATMPTIGSTEGDFSVNAAGRLNAAATGTAQAGVQAEYDAPILAADFTGATAGQTITVTQDGKTATVSLWDATASPAAAAYGTIAEGIAGINTALTAAGITQIEAVAHTYPANLADGTTAHPNATTASITFKQTSADLAAGNTPPAAPAVTVDGATLAINANDNDGVTGIQKRPAGQVTQLNLSSIFGTLRDGDTVAYTIDGKAASAVISSTQNADKSWTMTALPSATNTGVTGRTAGAVSLAFVNATTLKLTGTNANEPFTVDNIQVTRGIGADVAGTDISSFETATAALNVLDTAVASVNMKRAELGATANRLEYASDNMANISMNARASRSRVEDADYASETTELARTQIIQQAGTAMLAQANQSTQSVLKLLQ
jgi:flagellin